MSALRSLEALEHTKCIHCPVIALESALARKTTLSTLTQAITEVRTISRTHLSGLIRSAMKGQSSNLEILHLLLGPRGGLERSEHRSRANDVYPDVLGSELESEGSSEGDDCSFC